MVTDPKSPSKNFDTAIAVTFVWVTLLDCLPENGRGEPVLWPTCLAPPLLNDVKYPCPKASPSRCFHLH
jgi:hypothetical protein